MLLCIAGIFAIGLAWIAEHIWGMAPCGLCLLERWPYRLLILLGFLILIGSRRWYKVGLKVSLLVLFISLGLSLIHIGVEESWWSSPLPACHMVSVGGNDNIESRFANLPDRPNKPCDLPSYLFSWLPISMTALNGIYSFGLIIVTFGALRLTKKQLRFS